MGQYDTRLRENVHGRLLIGISNLENLRSLLEMSYRQGRCHVEADKLMKQDYVEFFSPGAFMAETRRIEVPVHNVDKAVELARGIIERHGARPFGFQFLTRERACSELDATETYRSGTYFLGGKLITQQEVIDRNDPKEDILRSNMRCNGIERVIENNNSWKYVGEFNDDDTLLDVTL